MSNVNRAFSERLESAIQLYLSNESLSIAECADESYVSASVLHKTLKSRGLSRDRTARWAENLERAIEIYCNEGLSVYAASKKAGVGNGTLGEALKARGLSRSPQSNKPDVELEIYSAEFKKSRGYSKALQLLHRSARNHQDAYGKICHTQKFILLVTIIVYLKVKYTTPGVVLCTCGIR